MVDKCKREQHRCGDVILVATAIADIVGFGELARRHGHSAPGLPQLTDARYTAAYSVPNYTAAQIQAGR